MIDIKRISVERPYIFFKNFYQEAIFKKQKFVEAFCISSFDKEFNSTDSRFVNLKYIIDDEWIFFSNYNSPKSHQFNSNNNISAAFFWDSINVQIRIKAKIHKTNKIFSDQHFKNRDYKKNALAVSSMQSKKIESYEDVIKSYEKTIENKKLISQRPEYWGGFTFIPYYFEFWQGRDNRLNERDVFFKKSDSWERKTLQP